MSREDFNEKARQNAEEFRKELAADGVEMKVTVHDTDEDYFVHLLIEAVSCMYYQQPQVRALGDLKALLLLGIEGSLLQRIDAAMTPEVTGENAYREYRDNVKFPRLQSLGKNCPPEVRAEVVQELEDAAPPHYSFFDILRDTYRAHPGLDLAPGGPEIIARHAFFRRRVEEALTSVIPKPKKKRVRKSRCNE